MGEIHERFVLALLLVCLGESWKLLSLYSLWLWRNPAKFFSHFLQIFSVNIQKEFTDELLQERREKDFQPTSWGKGGCWRFPSHNLRAVLHGFRVNIGFSLETFILAWTRPREIPQFRALAVRLNAFLIEGFILAWGFQSRTKILNYFKFWVLWVVLLRSSAANSGPHPPPEFSTKFYLVLLVFLENMVTRPKLAKLCVNPLFLREKHRSVQNVYRQTFSLRAIKPSYRCRIVMPEELISITETDVSECWLKISCFLNSI